MSKAKLVRDFMKIGVMTLGPDTPIFEAIVSLIKHKVSGAPVVDEKHALLGILSEKDCLAVFANEAFFSETAGGMVSDYMTADVQTVGPDADIFVVADIFLRKPYRKLPVVEDGILVGEISRSDILLASLHIVEESPKKRAWTDSHKIPDEILSRLATPAHEDA